MTSSNEKTTILYVEDNLENRVLVRRILMSEDYAVLEAVNAADALKILARSISAPITEENLLPGP